MTRIAVATLDTLGAAMAGPAIRAWEISRALAGAGHDVRLLTFAAAKRAGEGFAARHVDVGRFRAEVEDVDVLVVQGYLVASFPWLRDWAGCLVVDLYDPFHLESLEVERFKPINERHAALANALRELGAQVSRGDFFVCASEKQWDLWVGQLAASGRVNPETYDDDPTLRRLIDVAPFGTPATAPVQREHAVRGRVPGIGADDKVIVWGGGVYNWFDPLTVIRAVDRLRADVPDVRLYFLGMRHPNPDVPEMDMAVRTRALAHELGLVGTHVFFNEEWVDYDRRVDHLLDADIGVSTHFPHVETRFSFRTRILDYLWTGLPVVCTQGDTFGELVAAEGLGAAVPPEDVDALTDALRMLLTDEEALNAARRRVAEVAGAFTWDNALAPLVDYCADPRRAADAERIAAGRGSAVDFDSLPVLTRLKLDAKAVATQLRSGGVRAVADKVKLRVARERAKRR